MDEDLMAFARAVWGALPLESRTVSDPAPQLAALGTDFTSAEVQLLSLCGWLRNMRDAELGAEMLSAAELDSLRKLEERPTERVEAFRSLHRELARIPGMIEALHAWVDRLPQVEQRSALRAVLLAGS